MLGARNADKNLGTLTGDQFLGGGVGLYKKVIRGNFPWWSSFLKLGLKKTRHLGGLSPHFMILASTIAAPQNIYLAVLSLGGHEDEPLFLKRRSGREPTRTLDSELWTFRKHQPVAPIPREKNTRV